MGRTGRGTFGGDALAALAQVLRLADDTALYVEVGEGRLSAQWVVQKVVAARGGTQEAVDDLPAIAVPARERPRSTTTDPGVVVKA